MGIRRVVAAALAGTLVAFGLVAAPAAAAGPAGPSGLNASAEADGTVHFEWDAAPGASAYRLEWSADSAFASGTVATVDTYALDHITRWQPAVGEPTDLYWRVTAFGTSFTTSTLGEPSSTGLVTTGLASAPQPVAPGSEFGTEVIEYPAATVFVWAPVAGAIAYQLEYTSDTLGGGSAITTQTVNGNKYSPASPLARVDSNGNALTWKWRVRAQFYNGTSSGSTGVVYGTWSPEREFQVTWDVAPSNLYPADEVTTVHSDISFSWDAVPGAAKYRVTFGNSAEGSGDSKTILNPIVRDVYTTTYIPTAQTSDNTRFWQVTPLDYAGNPGEPSAVHQYRKKWGTQDAASSPTDTGDAAPAAITGSGSAVTASEVYLSDLEIAWQPLARATFYMLEVRDDYSNVFYCRTASTSATVVAYYASGLDNSGSGEVLESAGDCLWNTDPGKRIQPNRTYNWRVRAVDLTGSSGTGYQAGSSGPGTLPTGVQLSSWSQTKYFRVMQDDRPAPEAAEVDLDLDAFATANPLSASGQPAPLLLWNASGKFADGAWGNVAGYEVILYKNPQRTAEIARFRTPSTRMQINGVFADNTTANPYYASVRPIEPQSVTWTGSVLVVGGIANESVESFTWQKASQSLAGLSTQTLTDGSVRLSWDPQSVTGFEDGGSRGYQLRIFNGDTQLGITKKIEYPFFMAQRPAASSDGEFPSTATDVPLAPGNNYSFDIAPLDANGNPGRVTKSGAFSVGIATPVVGSDAVVSGGSVSLNWSSVPGALKYSVQYRKTGSESWTALTNLAQTSAALNGLDKGNFEWQVRTHDASGLSTNVSPWSAVQQFAVGADPSALAPADTSVLTFDNRVLSWSAGVDGAVRYQVQIADDTNFTSNVKIYETVATSFAVPDSLVAAKQYYWRVKALAEPVGNSSALRVLATSTTRTFTALTTPVKVTGVSLSRSGTGIAATWTLLTGANMGTVEANTYVVSYREKSVDGDWSTASEVETGQSATSLAVLGLVTGTTYQFRVAGKNSEGVGSWSDVKELSTATVPTAAPTLTVTPKLGELSLKIGAVTANGGIPVTAYALSYRLSSAEEWTSLTIPVTSTYSLTGLATTSDYQVSVAAVNAVGEGPRAEISAQTLGLATAPSSVTVKRGDKQAVVTWAPPLTPNGTVTGYAVEYRLGSTGTWTSAGSVASTATTVTKTGLVNGLAYEFRVAAKTSVGVGEFSAPLAVIPAGKPIPSTILKATSSSRGTVTVSWGKASPNGSAVTGYTVYYSTNGTKWYTLKSVSASTLKTTSTKGSHGKKIYFRVTAKSAVGTSAPSKTVSVIRK